MDLFTLVNVGRYEVNYQLTVNTSAGLIVYLGTTTATMAPVPYTAVAVSILGVSDQLSSSVIIETTTPNSFIAIAVQTTNSGPVFINPTVNSNPNVSTVSIKQIA